MISDLHEILDLPRQDYARVASSLFAYLFGVINKSQYTEYVGDRAISRAALKAARSSGYVLVNCKVYAYACWVARAKSQPFPRASEYKVSVKDGNFLRQLNLKKLPTRFYAFTLAEFERLVSQSFADSALDTYIGKYVSKKMSFLIKSYGVARLDLEGTMLQAAIYAVYKQYPRYESKLHLTNICKTTIHNTGVNLIQYHTRAKRQALSKERDGTFSAVAVPLSEILEIAAPEQDELTSIRESLQSLVSLESRMSPKVKEFLQCAVGVYHEGLSEAIGVANDDLVDRIPYPKYLSQLRTYFQVSEQQTQKLFSQLRPHL